MKQRTILVALVALVAIVLVLTLTGNMDGRIVYTSDYTHAGFHCWQLWMGIELFHSLYINLSFGGTPGAPPALG